LYLPPPYLFGFLSKALTPVPLFLSNGCGSSVTPLSFLASLALECYSFESAPPYGPEFLTGAFLVSYLLLSVLLEVFEGPDYFVSFSDYFGAFLALFLAKPSSSLESEASNTPNGFCLWVAMQILMVFQ